MSQDSLLPISKEVIEKVRKDLNLDEIRLKEAVDGIKEWLELQPHLPKEIDDGRIERWLIRCKNRMEETKKCIDLYYTMRTMAPEFMRGWDVNEPWFDRACKYYFHVPMPTLTKDHDRIIMGGFLQEHDDLFFIDNMKLILQVTELRMREDYNAKDIFVFDYKYFTLSDCQKVTLPLIKKFEVYFLRGCKTRLRAIHFLNTPSYAQFLVAFIKTILKTKLVERFHVYGQDLTEFYRRVPRELLPTEYGGNAGSITEHWGRWQKNLKNNRDWLISREHIKTDESKRSVNKMESSELFGFEGSFRKLTID